VEGTLIVPGSATSRANTVICGPSGRSWSSGTGTRAPSGRDPAFGRSAPRRVYSRGGSGRMRRCFSWFQQGGTFRQFSTVSLTSWTPSEPVGQCQLAVVDLAAHSVLLDMLPVAQRVFVLDSGALGAAEGDRPMRGVDPRFPPYPGSRPDLPPTAHRDRRPDGRHRIPGMSVGTPGGPGRNAWRCSS
jgi:hypothetical protein